MMKHVSRTSIGFGLILIVSFCIRMWLTQEYYGWEESDYGNLAMIYGVWDSGFTHYDMNHMPGYYFVSALLYGVFQDSILAGKLVSMVSGMTALWCTMRLLQDIGHSRCALWVGVLLLLQPEFVLYATSSLREPLYTAFILGAVAAWRAQSAVWFAFFAVCAFSVRFEAPLFLLPVAMVGFKSWSQRLGISIAIVCGIAIWAGYCWGTYETWQFWSHAASVNVETGLSGEAANLSSWWINGFMVVVGLLWTVLPQHLGWFVLFGWLITPYIWRKSQQVLLLWGWSALMLGTWLGIAFVAQHEVQHNLYWKWMLPFIPLLSMVSVLSWTRVLPKWGMALGCIYTLVIQGDELYRQFTLSRSLYKPQLDLAKWIEANIDPTEPMILDNVPACWIRRQPQAYQLYSWFDLPAYDTPEDLLLWSREHDVHWVLYFQEEWTQAPSKAVFLSEIREYRSEQGDIQLLAEEAVYGWRWFEVTY